MASVAEPPRIACAERLPSHGCSRPTRPRPCRCGRLGPASPVPPRSAARHRAGRRSTFPAEDHSNIWRSRLLAYRHDLGAGMNLEETIGPNTEPNYAPSVASYDTTWLFRPRPADLDLRRWDRLDRAARRGIVPPTAEQGRCGQTRKAAVTTRSRTSRMTKVPWAAYWLRASVGSHVRHSESHATSRQLLSLPLTASSNSRNRS